MKDIKKHIGIVVTKPPVYSEQFLLDKIKGLADRGYKITLFSNAFVPNNTPCRVVYALSSQPKINIWLKFMYYFFLGIANIHILYRYYIISKLEGNSQKKTIKYLISNFHILTHPLDWLHFEFSGLAFNREYVAKAIQCKMSVSIRGYDIAISPLKNEKVHTNTWKFIDKVHAISDDIINLAYKKGMPNTMLVHKINPAINPTLFPLKNDCGAIHRPVRIISVGRLHWKKGYNYILLALKELKNQNIDFSYSIIGEGNAMAELVYMAHMLGIENQVTFHGKIAHAAIPNHLINSDVFIQFSLQEGFSNAALEAQSCGLMVIGSDAEGLTENIQNEKTGWIVQKRNYIALSEKIKTILKMGEEERKLIGKAASERVKEHFNLDKQNKEFDQFYGG